MPFLGTIVNFFAVLICGCIGLLIKKGVPKRFFESVKFAMAICVIYIGIEGALESAPTVGNTFFSDGLVKVLIMVLSMAIGTFIGELIDLDKWVNRLGDAIEKRLANSESKGSFSEGFVTCSLMFCIGAMTVNGAFQDALGKPDILIAKAVIDGVMCLMLTPTLGIGCVASAFFVLIFQGILTVLGIFAADLLPAAVITYMSVTGSLIVIFVGTNSLGITKVKTANMLPSMFLPALLYPLFELIL